MPFGTPRIPTAYAAIDDEAYRDSSGAPLDAFVADAIEGAHNRLQACPVQMFSLPVPVRAVDFGEESFPSYTSRLTTTWIEVVPGISHRKKPGHDRASYRARVLAPSGADFQAQLVTRAAPYVEGFDTSRLNVFSFTGTGDWQTLEMDGVPVVPGDMERTALYLRSEDYGSASDTTYGNPSSGDIVEAFRTTLHVRETSPSSGLAWNWTAANAPNDWGSFGHFVQVSDPDGTVVGTWPIRTVQRWNDLANPSIPAGLIAIRGVLSDGFLARINASSASAGPFTFEILDPVRVSLASLAGAVEARTR